MDDYEKNAKLKAYGNDKIRRAMGYEDPDIYSKRGPRSYTYPGQRFGKLVIKSSAHHDSRGSLMVLCTCDCGKEVIRRLSDLKRKKGPTVSCGCARLARLTAKSPQKKLIRNFYEQLEQQQLAKALEALPVPKPPEE